MRKFSILFVALIVAAAVGYLLWSTRSSDAPRTAERASTTDAARPTNASTPAEQPAEKPELANAAALETPLADAAAAASEARTDVTIKARLKGRVLLPAGTPADETLEVFAAKSEVDREAVTRLAESDPASLAAELVGRATVATDGNFELPLTESAGSVHVFAFGRYASSRASIVATPDAQTPVEVAVELGAWIHGTLVLPAGAADEEHADLVDTVVMLTGSGTQEWNAQMGGNRGGESRRTLARDGRTFELRSAFGKASATLFARPEGRDGGLPRFAAARSDVIAVAPGSNHAVTIVLTRGGTLTGQIADENGAPVADVELEADVDPRMMGMGGDLARKAMSDADGRFVLAAMRAGKAKLKLEKKGYLTELYDAELAEGETRDCGTFKLTHGASLSGVVLWPDRTPVADAKVSAGFDTAALTGMNAFNAWRGNEGSTASAANGAFSIGGMGAGPFVLRAAAPPNGSAAKDTDETLFWRASLAAIAPGAEGLELVLQAPEGVQGRVVDETGAPVTKFQLIARATINSLIPGLSGNESRKSFDDAEGRFALAGLDRGSWELYALAEGFGDSEPLPVVLPRDASAPAIELKLVHAATVTGIVQGFDGEPVAGATVQRALVMADLQRRFRRSNEPERVQSGENGSFTFTPVSAGNVSLIARLEGAAASEKLELDLVAAEKRTDVVLRLRRGGTLTGEVFGDDGKPKAGANVLVQDPTQVAAQRMVRSDSQGRFREEHVEPGNWQVIYMPWMSDDGAMPSAGDTASILGSMKMTSALIKDGEETHVTLGAPPKNPVLVHGRVRCHGEAVSGVVVNFMADGGKGLESLKFVSVAADGTFETRLDGAGRYLITVQSFGNAGEQQAYEFAHRVPQEPEHTLDIEMPGARLSGRVLDGEGKPAPKTRVSLTSSGAVPNGTILGGRYSEISTDEDGRYVMRWLDPGDYTLSAGGALFGGLIGAKNPLGRELRQISVAKDADMTGVDFRLKASGSISGVARATNGQPLGGAAIFVRDEHDQLLERLSLSQTAGDGRFAYHGLAPGRYGISARSATDANAAPVQVEVKSGETTETELVLDAGTVLLVKLVDAKESEVEARVLVTDEKGRQVNGMLTMTELMEVFQSGGFSSTEQRIGPLAPGMYTVTATAPDGRAATKTVSLGGQAERKLTLRLRD